MSRRVKSIRVRVGVTPGGNLSMSTSWPRVKSIWGRVVTETDYKQMRSELRILRQIANKASKWR